MPRGAGGRAAIAFNGDAFEQVFDSRVETVEHGREGGSLNAVWGIGANLEQERTVIGEQLAQLGEFHVDIGGEFN
jgi:hypothetical protein